MHPHPALFPHTAWQPASSTGSSAFATPLGEVAVCAAVDEHQLRLEAAAAYTMRAGARLWVWDGGIFRAELLRCQPEVVLPEGMRVDGCEAAMWRLSATERPAECEVACRWVDSPAQRPSSPESGGNLEAQLWSDGKYRVSIGTPDLGESVRYLPDGFSVGVPLDHGAVFQTHFIVAWAADVAHDESTWLAVDCTAAQVLAGIYTAGG